MSVSLFLQFLSDIYPSCLSWNLWNKFLSFPRSWKQWSLRFLCEESSQEGTRRTSKGDKCRCCSLLLQFQDACFSVLFFASRLLVDTDSKVKVQPEQTAAFLFLHFHSWSLVQSVCEPERETLVSWILEGLAVRFPKTRWRDVISRHFLPPTRHPMAEEARCSLQFKVRHSLWLLSWRAMKQLLCCALTFPACKCSANTGFLPHSSFEQIHWVFFPALSGFHVENHLRTLSSLLPNLQSSTKKGFQELSQVNTPLMSGSRPPFTRVLDPCLMYWWEWMSSWLCYLMLITPSEIHPSVWRVSGTSAAFVHWVEWHLLVYPLTVADRVSSEWEPVVEADAGRSRSQGPFPCFQNDAVFSTKSILGSNFALRTPGAKPSVSKPRSPDPNPRSAPRLCKGRPAIPVVNTSEGERSPVESLHLGWSPCSFLFVIIMLSSIQITGVLGTGDCMLSVTRVSGQRKVHSRHVSLCNIPGEFGPSKSPTSRCMLRQHPARALGWDGGQFQHPTRRTWFSGGVDSTTFYKSFCVM